MSDYFSISNGVKQGGVISPVFFNLYLDNLLISLKQSGLGCHIKETYMGALLLLLLFAFQSMFISIWVSRLEFWLSSRTASVGLLHRSDGISVVG